ncbi:39S ribosomal protein L18, mitochondrial-like [Acipenser oxyrinchus oxyrinchus]|uniref:39S ribosomal protein L18, mitochondrial-like n=1 Tax=Acipenser oxyrinchus oxyrinchus TaxID=40147 RepID=A0AAD8FQR3_ACIOX|nr:39S ribosomal protein L18, mitochondrial-like [Acipenser oxyrinchus oxyrinchus]
MSLLKGIRGKWRVFGGSWPMRAAGVDFKDVVKGTAVRFSSCLVSPRPRDGEGESSEGGQRVPRGSAELVNPRFVNRNPRNLERMSLAMKDRGWETVWPRRACWHRLCIEHSQHHASAHVEHVPLGGGDLCLHAGVGCEEAPVQHPGRPGQRERGEGAGTALPRIRGTAPPLQSCALELQNREDAEVSRRAEGRWNYSQRTEKNLQVKDETASETNPILTQLLILISL